MLPTCAVLALHLLRDESFNDNDKLHNALTQKRQSFGWRTYTLQMKNPLRTVTASRRTCTMRAQ